jgi:nicotinamidase-related amidase
MLNRESTVLIVVDMQVNLARAMDDRTFLVENHQKLLKGALVLGVPVIVTEQIPLGPTIPEIAELLPSLAAITKQSFSCCAEDRFMNAVRAVNRRHILITGIEAHVCVYQTAMDLMAMGYEVHLTADAVSSRTARNREIGIQRMKAGGAVLTGVEMALFELLKTAADPKAKELFKIIK